MNKYCVFETLNHQDRDAIFTCKEQLKLYIEKYFSCIQLLSLMQKMDNNICDEMSMLVKDIARRAFYNQFETVCNFDNLTIKHLLEYVSDLEDEYENLKYHWDEIFEYKIVNNKVSILNYLGDETEIKIPKKIKGYSVSKIAENCFRGNNVLREVDIQADIEEIPSHCFYFCSNLEKIVISDSVKKIGSCAFCACDNLEEVYLGQHIEIIDFMAFYECKKLRTITLPNTIRDIYDGAFNKCKSIKKLYIPTNVQHIGYDPSMQTFSKSTTIVCCKDSIAERYAKNYKYDVEYISETESKLDYISEPEFVMNFETNYDEHKEVQWKYVFDYEVENGSVRIFNFKGCEAHIVVPKQIDGYPVNKIEKACFSRCNGLLSVNIKADITEIPSNCFSWCENLEKIILPDTICKISSGAFSSCKNLTYVFMGEHIKIIDVMAFYECKKLSKINLPDSLTHIYTGAFNKCKSIEQLVIPTNVQYIGYDATMQTFSKSTTIICEHNSVAEQYAIEYGFKIEYYTD